jgi:hypothetical protein
MACFGGEEIDLNPITRDCEPTSESSWNRNHGNHNVFCRGKKRSVGNGVKSRQIYWVAKRARERGDQPILHKIHSAQDLLPAAS